MYEHYREISLLNTAHKVFSNIVFQRVQPYVDRDLWNKIVKEAKAHKGL
jgi:hypothetical protein